MPEPIKSRDRFPDFLRITAEQLRADEMMERSACTYFLTKDDPSTYGEITDMLCGWMPETELSPDVNADADAEENLSALDENAISENSVAEETMENELSGSGETEQSGTPDEDIQQNSEGPIYVL